VHRSPALSLAARVHATVPADLCSGDPCNVSGPKSVDADSLLDFAGVHLVFKTGSVVTLEVSGNARSMTIRAGRITMEPGARILAVTDPDPSPTFLYGRGTVDLEATSGPLVLQSSGTTTSRIDVQGNWAGIIRLTATTDLTVDGSLIARGIGADAYAGEVELYAGGAITVSRDVGLVASGELGQGGTFTAEAGGNVSIEAMLDTSGGGFGGGEIAILSTAGDVATEILQSNATADGAGGEISLESVTGDVSLLGRITGNGSEFDESCGDGSAVTIVAGGSVTFSDDVTVRGGLFCTGGAIEVSAGGAFVQAAGAAITSSAPGDDSSGGELSVFAGGDATLRTIELNGVGYGGTLDVTAAGALDVVAGIAVRATGSDGYGGGAALAACTIEVGPLGAIDVRGDDLDSGVVLTASGAMTIDGTLRSDEENRLVYRTTPPDVTGATIVVPAVQQQDLTLPECETLEACGNLAPDPGEACDDGNHLSCDGCSADCQRVDGVCGDGTRECGEQCDDGDTTSGDGCEADCTLPPTPELLMPGSPLAQGCQLEWNLHTSNGTIASTGLPTRTQKCIDGDPACDSDGANDQRCTYEAQLCLRVTDERLPACAPAALDYVRLGAPTPNATDPINAGNAAAILDALDPLDLEVRIGSTVVQPGAPFAASDACTDAFPITVPRAVVNSGKRVLRVASQDVNGKLLKANQISLICVPNTAVCGDGITGGFEQCDLGDTVDCDGCSSQCRLEECGNGTVECGEQCDDGAENGTPGSPCSASCTEAPPALRIPGAGGKTLDCALEWSVALPAEGLLLDRAGIARNSQRCTDDDPSCDFDPTPGTCRMRVWACLGGADARLSCNAAQVATVDVTSPKANTTGTQLAARNDLLAALSALGLPAGPGEECTARIEVDIPARKALKLGTKATLGSGQKDTDALRLSCRP